MIKRKVVLRYSDVDRRRTFDAWNVAAGADRGNHDNRKEYQRGDHKRAELGEEGGHAQCACASIGSASRLLLNRNKNEGGVCISTAEKGIM